MPLTLAAQTQPPAAGQQGNLAQIIVGRPKPGSEPQYDESRKRHMAWHRSQNDAWSWFTWEIMTNYAQVIASAGGEVISAIPEIGVVSDEPRLR